MGIIPGIFTKFVPYEASLVYAAWMFPWVLRDVGFLDFTNCNMFLML